MNSEVLEQTEGFNVSNKYSVIKTNDVLNKLTNEGFQINSINEAAVRNVSKQGFQKHLLRISREDLDFNIEGLRPEVILINSYDGSSSFRLLIGVYRFACANGLIVGNSYFEKRIRHIGDVMPKVLEATEEVTKVLPLVAKDIEKFSNKELTDTQRRVFAMAVGASIVPKSTELYNSDDLLKVRRPEDHGKDLFTTLNVIQENALKGGLQYKTLKVVDGVKEFTDRRTRKVKSVDRSTKINQQVWDLAHKIAA